MDPRTNPWLAAAREPAQRLLGLMDRDPGSATYGCCDRGFWHYQVLDYPSAWFQVGAEYLRLLRLLPGGAFTGKAILGDWSRAACRFALRWLNADGSAMEVYPLERSFCATAFLGGHLAACLETPGDQADDLARLGGWLRGRLGEMVSNQLAAAALAQFRLGRLLNSPEFTADGRAKLAALWSAQRPDGTLPERGGLDVGYQTISLGLLARIDREFPGQVDPERVARALAVLEPVVDAQGRYDCRVMSRGTQFLYPSGLAHFGSPLLGRLRAGLAADLVLRPNWLDDRYAGELALDYAYTALWFPES